MPSGQRGNCTTCGREFSVNANGKIRSHSVDGVWCVGSYDAPRGAKAYKPPKKRCHCDKPAVVNVNISSPKPNPKCATHAMELVMEYIRGDMRGEVVTVTAI